MRRNPAGSGEGKLGCILWLTLVAIGALIAWKAIPVKIAAAELQDFMTEQAKFAPNAPAEGIANRIYEKAVELDLPVDRRNIVVAKSEGRIRMSVTFMVTLDFPLRPYDWEFDLRVDRPIFIF